MNAAVQIMDAELKLKKAHIRLMRHPETCLYSGIILLGDTKVVDGDDEVPTACTDGINTFYGRTFLNNLSVEETAGLALHENLHKLLKHIGRHKDLTDKDPMLANVAMDFVVNDVIMNLKDKALAKLPDGALYDPMFHDWSVRQVFDYLYKEQEKRGKKPEHGQPGNKPSQQGGQQGQPPRPIKGSGTQQRGQPLDQHDHKGKQGKHGKGGNELSPDDQRELERKINEALQQGGILAGKFGVDIPRTIKNEMEPEIAWSDVLDEFWTGIMRGVDEFTYSRLNRRRLADDLYLPSSYSETVGQIVLAIDTSGSIDDAQLARVASRITNLCELYPPESIIVLWWDTRVHAEQHFESQQYANIAKLLKPVGGGGTRASCVSQYMNERNINADGVIVFTDGHLEPQVEWNVACPTLWLVTQNKAFTPPHGRKVMVKN
jgi:predicted metal-dependent peptidase